MSFFEEHLGEHIAFTIFGRRVVIFGFNAMHVAINIQTKRWGYVCFHPTIRCFGKWWPWYLYISPNATPWASTFAIGPGVYSEERSKAKERRRLYGHNFNTDLLR